MWKAHFYTGGSGKVTWQQSATATTKRGLWEQIQSRVGANPRTILRVGRTYTVKVG
jgi:hypothetical protein